MVIRICPLLSGAIAYNILTDRKDIIKPIGFHRDSTALNDTDMKYLLLYLEETYGQMCIRDRTSIVEELLYLLIKTEKCYTEKN